MNCSYGIYGFFTKWKKNHDSGRIPDFFSITYRLQKDKRNVFLRQENAMYRNVFCFTGCKVVAHWKMATFRNSEHTRRSLRWKELALHIHMKQGVAPTNAQHTVHLYRVYLKYTFSNSKYIIYLFCITFQS